MSSVPPKASAADVLKKLQTAIDKVAIVQQAVRKAAQQQAVPSPPSEKKV